MVQFAKAEFFPLKNFCCVLRESLRNKILVTPFKKDSDYISSLKQIRLIAEADELSKIMFFHSLKRLTRINKTPN